MEYMLDRLLETEGGFVNHPADRGGPTKYGITQSTLERYRGRRLSTRDVALMAEPEAREIYRKVYWMDTGLYKLQVSPLVGEMLFDAAVHHGHGISIRMLQRAIGVLADGVIGPVTREVAQSMRPDVLAANFLAERAEFYGRLISADTRQAVFAAGWMARLSGFIQDIPFTGEQ